MSDDLDEMRALVPKRGMQCDLCRLLGEMSLEHAALVRRGLADATIPDIAVAAWISAKGYVWNVKDAKGCVLHHRQMRHE